MLKFQEKNHYNQMLYNEGNRRGQWINGRVPYIVFPSLKEIHFIGHGFSTRFGGVSEGHLSSMNLSYSREDNPKSVTENYNRIANALQFSTNDLVLSDQVHDTIVENVTEINKQGNNLQDRKLVGVDGMVTNTPNLVLSTSYADCVPLFFVDKKEKAIGLSHSGWRGTVKQIGLRTVEKMKKEFSSKEENIICVIGPSICRDCYQVSKEVASDFNKILSKQQCDRTLEQTGQETFQLDLWLANRFILENAGIPIENISISEICTCCNQEILYSHRASKGKRGNLSAFLWIK